MAGKTQAGQGNRVVLSSGKDLATGGVWERVPGEEEEVSQAGAAGQLKVGRQLGSCDWSLTWSDQRHRRPLPASASSFPTAAVYLALSCVLCRGNADGGLQNIFFS